MHKKIDRQFALLRGEEVEAEETRKKIELETRDEDEDAAARELRQEQMVKKREAQLLKIKKTYLIDIISKLKIGGTGCGVLVIILVIVAAFTDSWKVCSKYNYSEGLWTRCTDDVCVKNYGPPLQNKFMADATPDDRCKEIANGEYKIESRFCSNYSICWEKKYMLKTCVPPKKYFNILTEECQSTRPLHCKDQRCEGKVNKVNYPVPGDHCRKFFTCIDEIYSENSCSKTDYFDTETKKCKFGDKYLPAGCSDARCIGKTDGKFYKVDSICRRYYKCLNGAYHESECPTGQMVVLETGKCQKSPTPAGCLGPFVLRLPKRTVLPPVLKTYFNTQTSSDNPLHNYMSSCMWFKHIGPYHSDCNDEAGTKQWPNRCRSGVNLMVFSIKHGVVWTDDGVERSSKSYLFMNIGLRGKRPFVYFDRPHDNFANDDSNPIECDYKKLCDGFPECNCTLWSVVIARAVSVWQMTKYSSQAENDTWNHLCQTVEHTSTPKKGINIKLWLNNEKTERFISEEMTIDKMFTNQGYSKTFTFNRQVQEISLGFNDYAASYDYGYANFIGDFKDVYFWNKTLSDEEVEKIYLEKEYPEEKMIVDWEEFRNLREKPEGQCPSSGDSQREFEVVPKGAGDESAFGKKDCECQRKSFIYTKQDPPVVLETKDCKNYGRCSYYESTTETCDKIQDEGGQEKDTYMNTVTQQCMEQAPPVCDDKRCIEIQTASIAKNCSEYYRCTKSSENKWQYRTEKCESGKMWDNNNEECTGEERRPLMCSTNGGYSKWGHWEECSSSSGTGLATRKRTCTNPPPINNGAKSGCEHLGPKESTEPCGPGEGWLSTATSITILTIVCAALGSLAGGVGFCNDKNIWNYAGVALFAFAALFGIVALASFSGGSYSDCDLSPGYSLIMVILAIIFSIVAAILFVFVCKYTLESDRTILPEDNLEEFEDYDDEDEEDEFD